MLTDEQVDVYYALIRDRIDKVNDKYLKEIGEQIAAIGELNTSSVRKLAQMRKFGASSEKMRRELARMLRMSQVDIQTLYNRAVESEYADAAFALSKIGQDISDPKQNKELVRYVEAVARQTAETFENWSNTTVISQNYQRIVSDGVDAVSRGVSDYRSVIRRSIKEYGGDGLSVVYESGVKRRLDTAIRQNILDGTRQISMRCAKMIGEEIGADGVELSAHPFSALDHEPCQGRQYTNDNYELMQSGQRFFDVDGKSYDGFDRPITQWNCRHFASPILIGISPRRYTDEQLEAWKQANHKGCTIDGKHYTIYQASQLMRKMETEVRRQKDIANLATASGDDVLRRDAQARITKCKAIYRKVSETCGLKQRPEKMVVNSYKDDSNGFTSNSSNGIISKNDVDMLNVESENGKFTYADTVKSPLIQTTEYRKKFDSLGESTEITREMYQSSVRMIKHRSGTKFEDMTFINSSTGELRSRTDYDVENKVEPSKMMKRMVRENDQYTIICIHNHPGSGTPSIQDVWQLSQRKYKFGLIACHDGTVYKYKLNDKALNLSECDFRLTDLQNNIRTFGINSAEAEEAIGNLKKAGLEVEVY